MSLKGQKVGFVGSGNMGEALIRGLVVANVVPADAVWASDVRRDRLAELGEKYGIRLMSLGFILDADTPVIWRGPMVMRAIEQMLGDVDWGALDFMVLDLPPGTGDAQLTVTQKVPLAGAVIVTTPQDVALLDARRGLQMFHKVSVPVLGIVENMSYFIAPDTGARYHIFGEGGGQRVADEYGVPLLAQLPLDPETRKGGDEGAPITVRRPDSAQARAFGELARRVVERIDSLAGSRPLPSIG